MWIILSILTGLTIYAVYLYFKKKKQLDAALDNYIYGSSSFELFDFLDENISDDNIRGNIINNEHVTQIITKGDIVIYFQVFWKQNIIVIDYSLNVAFLPFVHIYNNQAKTVNIYDQGMIKNRVDDLLIKFHQHNIIN